MKKMRFHNSHILMVSQGEAILMLTLACEHEAHCEATQNICKGLLHNCKCQQAYKDTTVLTLGGCDGKAIPT